jgi:hypothetical protein
MAGTVTYNLEHAQVALTGASPTFLDVPGVTTMGATISSSVSYFAGDGAKKYAAWSAPEGGGNIGFAEADFAVLEVINGGEASTTGTTPAIVERYVPSWSASRPAFILVGYGSNVNPNADRAGFRIILPNASAAPSTIAMGQETWGEWTADLAITPDEDDQPIIYEKLETAPTFTNGVFANPLAA